MQDDRVLLEMVLKRDFEVELVCIMLYISWLMNVQVLSSSWWPVSSNGKCQVVSSGRWTMDGDDQI